MKWIAYATGATFAMVLLAISLNAAAPDSALTKVMSLLGDAMFAGIPVAVEIAVLKYRLYDIDRIINRTLVYGPLTVTLVALYFGGVVLLQRVFIFLTGERSTLAVVASTLVIAVLFNPPEIAHPVLYRQALLSQDVRRCKDPGSLFREAA